MTTTIFSPTFDALLATVCDHPGDPAPMLVLADWMDENLGHDAGRVMRWAAKEGKFPFVGKEYDGSAFSFWYVAKKGKYPSHMGSTSLPYFFGRKNGAFPPGRRSLPIDSWKWLIDNFPDELRHTPL
jgi:uncharacterized protein (TIGR02996 family)